MQMLAVEARTAHDRFGLTHELMLREVGWISKREVAVACKSFACSARMGELGLSAERE